MDWRFFVVAYAVSIAGYTLFLRIAAPAANPFVSAFVLEGTAALVLLPFFLFNSGSAANGVPWQTLVAAGVLLGGARAAYSFLFATDTAKLAIAGTASNILITLLLLVLGVFLLQEKVSQERIAGVLMGCTGVYLLLK